MADAPEIPTEDTVEVVDFDKLPDADKIEHIFRQLPQHLGKPIERKILAAILLPETKNWTITRICEAAGIRRENWYIYHKKPEFIEKCIALCKEVKGIFAPRVFQSFIRNAIEGGPHGFGDTKAQLEYLQDLGIMKSPEGSKGTNINLDVNVNVIEEKRIENQKRGLAKLGFELPDNITD